VTTQTLVSKIDLDELTASAPPLIAWKLGLVESEDEVAAFMYHGGLVSPQASAGGTRGEDHRPPKTYWEAVKTEMHMFLCTTDKRYRELWKRIAAIEGKGTTALVGVVATFLGASIGAPATLIAGFVAVCLYGVAKLGKEAYCRYASHRGA
jgi:ABC-type dipeptide/oligopeptide/nickel transport system permease subunit